MLNLSKIQIIYDGNLHRFYVDGDTPGSKNGWYLAKPNGWIVYATWKDPLNKYYINKDGAKLTELQKRDLNRDLAIDYKIRRLKQDEIAKKLESKLAITYGTTHPYFEKKGFYSFVWPVSANRIMIPIYDYSMHYKKLISIQYIFENGEKRFASETRTKGGMFVNKSLETAQTIYLCEGFATGLTIHYATKDTVATCFYASNIIHVCDILHNRFNKKNVIICADNDRQTPGNPGVTAAQKAAEKYDYKYIVPFLDDCNENATDFNDIMVELSLQEVRRQLEDVNRFNCKR